MKNIYTQFFPTISEKKKNFVLKSFDRANKYALYVTSWEKFRKKLSLFPWFEPFFLEAGQKWLVKVLKIAMYLSTGSI